MPHEEPNFQGFDFVGNLPNINLEEFDQILKMSGSGTSVEFTPLNYIQIAPFLKDVDAASAGMVTEVQGEGFTSQVVDSFFSIFSATNKRLPTDWSKFITAFRDEYSLPESDPLSGPAFDGYVETYRTLLSMNPTGSTLGGDWSLIEGVTAEDIENQFVASFSHFLQDYPYPPVTVSNPNGVIEGQIGFFPEWYEFLTTTAGMSPLPNANIATYKMVYDGYFPGGSEQAFVDRLNDFYQAEVDRLGFFVPSFSFGEWFQGVQDDYSISLSGAAAPGNTSVDTSASDRVIILDRIFRLLVLMIDVLQKIAAAQANRLNFLTQWQKAYTDEMNQIHVFAEGNGDSKVSGSGDNAANHRDDLNRVNATYTEEMRANRDVIGDDAKSLQANINQTNDAVTQQANMATAILQEFSTLLGAIFR